MTALPTLYQSYIHLSRYSRWIEEKKRRETWPETVSRYVSFFRNKLKKDKLLTDQLNSKLDEVEQAILNLEIMPSMRALMTAGPALEKDNVAGFNCSFLAIDDQKAFDELLYILCCGTGVGFSVEADAVSKLPEIPKRLYSTNTVIVVEDSKIGWASAFRELIALLYSGKLPTWDVSKVRPAGARLKTFGGRASGPGPLVDLFQFTVNLFMSAGGRKLKPLEAHDLCCKIADIVVVGGVRRSALISLSDLSDDLMRDSKSGQWWENQGQRRLANNSAVYKTKPEMGIFMKEWLSLYQSKSGERGIFNREAAIKQVLKTKRRDPEYDFGVNPCGEIILRSNGFCNLTEVVAREDDTPSDLNRKVKLATFLGTLQSSLTDFRYLRDSWKKNAEEERLLGVSLTGIMDNPYLSKKKLYRGKKLTEILDDMKVIAIKENKKWAKEIGINESASITCVKPSGTVSQLVDSASGIHPRFSKYYVRTVRADKKDPLAQLMETQGFPVEDDVTKPEHNFVFSFPVKSPENPILRNDMSAIEQLRLWLVYQKHWCEHNPSITVYVKDHEWLEVGAFVYKNFDEICGISFLPYSDHIYRQAPYQEITEEEYKEWVSKMPESIDWKKLSDFEKEDTTENTKELACSAGVCEI